MSEMSEIEKVKMGDEVTVQGPCTRIRKDAYCGEQVVLLKPVTGVVNCILQGAFRMTNNENPDEYYEIKT